MQELKVDIWEYKRKKIEEAGAIAKTNIVICIPTNSVINHYGENIMGAGFAYAAKQKEPRLAKRIGMNLEQFGNHVVLYFIQTHDGEDIYANFPTKNNWKDKSSEALIDRSCVELATLAREHSYFMFLLPRPGCGEGGLNWEKHVKEICETRFHKINNIYIVERP